MFRGKEENCETFWYGGEGENNSYSFGGGSNLI